MPTTIPGSFIKGPVKGPISMPANESINEIENIPIEKVKREAIDKRRQDSNNIVKERKRRLSELYCVSRLPLLPLSNDQMLQIKDMLALFLEKNDLEKGYEFSISALAHEKRDLVTEDAENDTRPPKKLQKTLPIQASEILTRKHIELSPDEAPTLSSMIHKYTEQREAGRADEKVKRDLDYENVEIKKLLVTLMPERKPHKVAAARSLTEMFYHQQTLQLPKLLLRARKTLTSESFETSLVEGKVSVLYSRIEELKRKHSWSLRQPRKYLEPFLMKGRKTHWDYLLSESKWLATDMKQERRFKVAQCYFVSQAVQDYWSYGKVCCIKTKPIVYLKDVEIESKVTTGTEVQVVSNDAQGYPANGVTEDVTMTDAGADASADAPATEVHPEVDDQGTKSAEGEDKSIREPQVDGDCDKDVSTHEGPKIINLVDIVVEEATNVDGDAGISSKKENDDETVKEITIRDAPMVSSEQEPIVIEAEKEVEKLRHDPMMSYAPLEKTAHFFLHASLDTFTPTEVSIVEHLPAYDPFSEKEPDHIVDRDLYGHVSALLPPPDEEPEWEKIVFRQQDDADKHIATYQKALFGPYRRFNVLKPPKPPSIRNIELRIPTIWLPQDDRYLIKYVTEFSFNWEIISAHLSSQPTLRYFSNIERRTPWQCFERYIQLNNRFRFSDMRGVYTIAAKEWLEAAHRVQATTRRRISPLGVGQESIQRGNRRLRWASMLEAIRKLMKKRESIQRPAPQERKPAEIGSFETPSPEDLSKLKWERDKAIQQAYVAANPKGYNDRVRANPSVGNGVRSAVAAATASHIVTNGVHQHDGGMAVNQRHGQSRPMSLQATVSAASAAGYTPEQIQRLVQIQRQRQKQALAQRVRQVRSADSNSVGGSMSASSSRASSTVPTPLQGHAGLARPQTQPPASTFSSPSTPAPTPEQVLAAAAGQHAGRGSPVASNLSISSPVHRSSPRISFTTAQVSAIISQIQTRNPNLSKDQVSRLAVAYLANYQQKLTQRQKQGQHAQQIQQAQRSSRSSPIPAISSPRNQNVPMGKRAPRKQLTPQQLAMLAENPKLTPQQRQQVQILQQQQQQQIQRRQQQAKVLQHTNDDSGSPSGNGSHHTPTPEEIQLAMNRRRTVRDSNMVVSEVARSPQKSSTPSGSPHSVAGANLNLEVIENDLLNADFSFLEGAWLSSSPHVGNASLSNDEPNNTM
ncbi:hypothetical protein FOA43_003720 [Brettanomyces nanus]|uniref:Chromatin modification-related protein EAF1 n=1 Tax=Eeniella nana TaxID=13502 RepID=A0A875SBV2_EENNA|nr:uncharacterized protein FOA43_003720 [Brettanomyces nanus]QPG76334.1 hypothetical protein FOA43_003720 [Brettanomyces nanus]